MFPLKLFKIIRKNRVCFVITFKNRLLFHYFLLIRFYPPTPKQSVLRWKCLRFVKFHVWKQKKLQENMLWFDLLLEQHKQARTCISSVFFLYYRFLIDIWHLNIHFFFTKRLVNKTSFRCPPIYLAAALFEFKQKN